MPENEAPQQSKVHRMQVGDRVAYTTDGHDELHVNDEGEVVGFGNEEGTYLEVEFDDHDESVVVTEDELRRLAG